MNRHKPTRLHKYDYSSDGAYFVTICTYNRIEVLSEIHGSQVRLSEFGEIAAGEWLAIGNRFPDVELGSFVIMPNHIHGILVFSTTSEISHPTLSLVIGGFKSLSVNRMKNNPYPFWQRSFHDHIIRNERSYSAIDDYIRANPINWAKDEYYLSNSLKT